MKTAPEHATGTSGTGTVHGASTPIARPFHPDEVRGDFQILERPVRGRRLAYLDNAATTQKPEVVIEALARYYREENANIHRGIHYLSERATSAYERARLVVQRFIGAAHTGEIVFVRGTTEALNLVAQCCARPRLEPGDEVLITGMEHHSNIVPWQIVCEATGARVRAVPLDERGAIALDDYARLIGPRTRLVSVAHISNALGTVNPVRKLVDILRARCDELGVPAVPLVVDGAQAVAHTPVDVAALGCDFYAFSGHKVLGPTGVGVLYGRRELLEAMPPYQGGGGMIASVTFERTTYAEPPERFEAGTPNIAGVIGLGTALQYLEGIDVERVAQYEQGLLARATARLEGIDGLRLIGTADEKASILSFTLEGAHPHDVATILDQEGVAVRAGHHCAQPVMERFGVPATARASIALYNDDRDIEALAGALEKVREIFA